MTTLAIVDYGAGNLRSIQKALAYVAAPGIEVLMTADPAVVDGADAVVLPGVGAAGATMHTLAAHGLIDPLRRAASDGRPFLGICLGMQLLFEHLEEDDVAGLGVLPGRVRRLPGGVKVPHIGWNSVRPTAGAGDAPDPYYYFVHSYYVEPAPVGARQCLAGLVVGTTFYGREFCSALAYGPLRATQFHPEKSGPAGLRLLADFVRGLEN